MSSDCNSNQNGCSLDVCLWRFTNIDIDYMVMSEVNIYANKSEESFQHLNYDFRLYLLD